jgi:hypothetical protein
MSSGPLFLFSGLSAHKVPAAAQQQCNSDLERPGHAASRSKRLPSTDNPNWTTSIQVRAASHRASPGPFNVSPSSDDDLETETRLGEYPVSTVSSSFS